MEDATLVVERIRERIAEHIKLSELALIAGISERQLSRLFREAFGTTPYRFVLNERLDEAARRLRKGSQQIVEIAFDLGFSSQSHLSTAFRQRFGVSPRQYALALRERGA